MQWGTMMARVASLALVLAGTAVADSLTDGEGRVWKYYVAEAEGDSGATATITSVSPQPAGELEIPAELGGLPVTRISSYTFSRCTNLTAVTIPTCVTNLGSDAFSRCTSLARVDILAPKIQGSFAFRGCTGVVSATIPATYKMKSLFPAAYRTIRDVTVTEGAEALPAGMFADCAGLETVVLPSTLTALPKSCFSGCGALASLTLPAGVVEIDGAAFKNCTALTELTIPAGTAKLARTAFKGCSSLRRLTFLGACPKSTVDLKALPADLEVRVLSGGAGWPLSGSWSGRTFTVVTDPDVEYEVPVVPDGSVVGGLDAARALTLSGCVMDEKGEVTRIVTLKIGKAGRKGSKVAASVIGLDGARVNAPAATAVLSAGPAALDLSLRTGETLRLVIGSDAAGQPAFTGWFGTGAITSAAVGGALTKDALFTLPGGFAETFQAGVVAADFLPTAEPVAMADRKWTCAGAASVAYRKDRETGAYGWVVNGGKDVPAKSNLSGLKLTYSADKGTFKGSFKVYSLLNNGLRKATVTVTGVVVDGVGHGQAREKTLGVWPVRVE